MMMVSWVHNPQNLMRKGHFRDIVITVSYNFLVQQSDRKSFLLELLEIDLFSFSDCGRVYFEYNGQAG